METTNRRGCPCNKPILGGGGRVSLLRLGTGYPWAGGVQENPKGHLSYFGNHMLLQARYPCCGVVLKGG